MADLLKQPELPENFSYPREFVRIVELGVVNLEPWWIIEGDHLRQRQDGLRSRYPDRQLVVFAERQDRDDVACWDLDRGCVSIVHDLASPGWEQVSELPDFYSWLRTAVDELIEWAF